MRRRWSGGAAGLATAALAALSLAALPANRSAGKPADDPFAGVRSAIQAKLTEEQVPSLAVAMVRNGKILWEEGFGWADRESRIPATEHTIYSIGSLSKTLTATGLMTLAQRGAVDLDQPANRYLGGAHLQAHVGDGSKATVRSLASHTSGLARHSTIYYRDEPGEPPPMEEAIRRYGHLLREPGETYEYSNFGYGVLAYLIEQVSGTRLDSFLRQEIFLPLGMTHTSVGVGARLEGSCAVSYTRDQTPMPAGFHKPGYPGSGGLYSSAHDLARFALFHLRHPLPDQKKILSDASIQAMQEPRAPIAGENGYGMRSNSYGMGWNLTPDRYGYRQVFHSGHDGYSTSLLTLVPEEDLGVVVLMSGGNPIVVVEVADEILAALLPKYGERMKQPAAGPQAGEAEAQPYKPGEPWLGHWVGSIETYAGIPKVELWFKESGDVHVQMGGQLRTLLNGTRIENGYLRGSFSGDIGTDDANRRRPYNLHVKLKPRGNVLNGSITASTLGGRRAGDVLSYWMEVKRESPQ